MLPLNFEMADAPHRLHRRSCFTSYEIILAVQIHDHPGHAEERPDVQENRSQAKGRPLGQSASIQPSNQALDVCQLGID